MYSNAKVSLGLLAAVALATPAVAADEAPKFAYSFNIGATNDYVFRGVAQRKEDPSVQGGIDLTYGIGYFGLWASNIDFGKNNDGSKQVSTELDIYGGIKPVVGPATFDLGVIYYAYPGANDNGSVTNTLQVPTQDYVEFKGGVSGAFIPTLDKLTLGGTVFYSPEYQGKQGSVWTVEGNASYEFPAVGPFTPTLGGTIGAQYGDAGTTTIGNPLVGKFTLGNGSDDLTYYNIGVTLAVEKFSFDFRYWNSDISNKNKFCTGAVLQCDEQFAFIGKFTY